MRTRITGVQSEKFLKKKRKQRNIRIVVGVLLLFSVVTGLSKLSSWSRITVNTVEVKGNEVIKSEDLVALVDQQLTGNYLFLFSKRNSFLYPQEAIVEQITDSFKRIKEISVGTEQANVLSINLTERDPVGLWCDTDRCFYLDETAYIFAEAPHFTEEVYITFRGKVVTEPLGKTYLPLEEFNSVRMFADEISEIGLPVTSITSKDGGEYEFVIKNLATAQVDSTNEGVIFVNTREPFEKTLGNIQTFITEYRNRHTEGLKPIEYIDARFGNNIVFKFKEI